MKFYYQYFFFNFQVFKALDSAYSHLHHRLQNSCKEPAISSRPLLKNSEYYQEIPQSQNADKPMAPLSVYR